MTEGAFLTQEEVRKLNRSFMKRVTDRAAEDLGCKPLLLMT